MSDAIQAGDAAAAVVNKWAWWRNALKGEFGPIHDGDPQQGYYRTKSKGGEWEPVAIWQDDDSGEWLAYRAGREVRADDIWTFCCRSPVTYEAYNAALAGNGWSDEDATVAAQVKEPGIGDNSGEVDQSEKIKDQITAALAGLDAYKKITDDNTASKAQSLRNRLNELSGDADKKRDELKRPHLEAGKAIDKKWMPLVKEAKAGADTLRKSMGDWETVKLNRQREADRKAEQARIAAEEASREQDGETEVVAAPKVETQPAPPMEPIGQVRATYGKAASVSVKIVVDQVEDWSALAVYMSGHSELQDLLRKLAQRAIDAGRQNIPGITTKEEANVR